jgi:YVTN family beta-propeller protein
MKTHLTRFAGRLPLVVALTLLVVPAQGRDTPEGGATDSNRIVREGIAIQFEMEPVAAGTEKRQFREGDLVRFRFRVNETNSGAPLSGLYPAAWLDLHSDEGQPESRTCKQKVASFIGASLLSPAELDLNVYYVLALNDDATISVVDPLFGFGTTKLRDMIFLKSPGEDWVLTSDQKTLFVSMPDSDQVAVADTSTWDVVTNLSVGPRPSRVALQPDGKYLWVGHDAPPEQAQASGVTVIDTEGPSVVRSIPTGRGHHEIVFSPDDRFAFVTNQGDGTLSVIDIRTLERIKQIDIGNQPVSIAYSPAGRAAYVVNQGDGTIAAVDGERHEVVARIQADPGLGQIKMAPGGRFAFVVNPEKDVLHILDASVNRIIQSGSVQDGPDQVAFSDHLAYIRHRDSEIVLMVPLDKVGREGEPFPVVDFPGGQRPFGRVSRASIADAIVQAPGATAVLVANAADKSIYYYKEGMAAPMGNFQNYSREPRAVLAVDRSLEEKSPGSYETVAQLGGPGLYDVAFFLDSPRTIHCFSLDVAPDPVLAAERLKRRPIRIEPATEAHVLTAGNEAMVKFRLIDSATGKPRDDVKDVNILTFRSPGVARREHPAEALGGGVYGIRFVPRDPGIYYAFVGIPSADLQYNMSPFVMLRAEPPAQVPASAQAGGGS